MLLEKVSQKQFKSVLQKGKFCIRDSGLFFKEMKNNDAFLEIAILVTVGVMCLSPVISHQAGFSALTCTHPSLLKKNLKTLLQV